MRTVWKFVVPVDDREHEIVLPGPGKIVHVGVQGGDVVVWAEFRNIGGHDGATTLRLRVFGTGHEIVDVPDPYRHVGTAFVGPFVWHVYQRSSVIV